MWTLVALPRYEGNGNIKMAAMLDVMRRIGSNTECTELFFTSPLTYRMQVKLQVFVSTSEEGSETNRNSKPVKPKMSESGATSRRFSKHLATKLKLA